MKKGMSFLLALLMAVTLFAGCGAASAGSSAAVSAASAGSAVSSSESHEPVTVKWMHHYAEESRIAWAQAVADKTHELYPWVTVEIENQPYDQYVQMLKTKIQSGDAPDLYDGTRALVSEFAKNDYIVDLSQESWTADVMTAGLDAGRFGDKIYSVVPELGGTFVFYNKDIFEQNGLTVPTTYSEWMDLLKKVKAAGIAPIAAGYQDVWPMEYDFYSDAIPGLFKDDPNWAAEKMSGDSKFTGDTAFAAEMQRFYERSRYTQDDAFGSDWNKACELMATEKTAMVISGMFAVDAIKSKNADVNLGAFALPESEDEKDSLIPFGLGGGFMVNNGENQEAAKLLLSVIMSKEMGSQYQTAASTISSIKDVGGDIDPAFQDILAIEKDGRAFSFSQVDYSFTGEYEDIFRAEVAKFAMADTMDVDGLASRLDDEFSKVEA